MQMLVRQSQTLEEYE
uniref:Uncharacterized protein n=1 Tax=Lepeophtheirus salmonis TaxID=72036 RepID=A0A0K2TDK2_LEPSM